MLQYTPSEVYVRDAVLFSVTARRWSALVLACFALTFLPATAGATAIAPVSDTFITIHYGLGGSGSSHGTENILYYIPASDTWNTDPLLQFDLSAYAGQVVAGSPFLRLTVTSTWGGGTYSAPIDLYQVLISWAEDVSWNGFDPNGPTAGTDYASAALSQQSVTVFPGAVVDIPIPAGVVQSWIDNPSGNHGLIIVSNVPTRDFIFGSRESGDTTAPTLNFDAVPEPATMVLFSSALGLLIGLRVKKNRA